VTSRIFAASQLLLRFWWGKWNAQFPACVTTSGDAERSTVEKFPLQAPILLRFGFEPSASPPE
jgi:hypothetical protein